MVCWQTGLRWPARQQWSRASRAASKARQQQSSRASRATTSKAAEQQGQQGSQAAEQATRCQVDQKSRAAAACQTHRSLVRWKIIGFSLKIRLAYKTHSLLSFSFVPAKAMIEQNIWSFFPFPLLTNNTFQKSC